MKVEQIRPCPECYAGKHDNCPGSAWDTVADREVDCPCGVLGHGR